MAGGSLGGADDAGQGNPSDPLPGAAAAPAPAMPASYPGYFGVLQKAVEDEQAFQVKLTAQTKEAATRLSMATAIGGSAEAAEIMEGYMATLTSDAAKHAQWFEADQLLAITQGAASTKRLAAANARRAETAQRRVLAGNESPERAAERLSKAEASAAEAAAVARLVESGQAALMKTKKLLSDFEHIRLRVSPVDTAAGATVDTAAGATSSSAGIRGGGGGGGSPASGDFPDSQGGSLCL